MRKYHDLGAGGGLGARNQLLVRPLHRRGHLAHGNNDNILVNTDELVMRPVRCARQWLARDWADKCTEQQGKGRQTGGSNATLASPACWLALPAPPPIAAAPPFALPPAAPPPLAAPAAASSSRTTVRRSGGSCAATSFFSRRTIRSVVSSKCSSSGCVLPDNRAL
jgi:hypothetical protein